MASPTRSLSPFGQQLRHWRQVRGMSQLQLATSAETTSRHVSFVETGRSRPTTAMVLRLAETLDVPLRDRNRMLASAGLAPVYPEHALSDDALAPVRRVIEIMLARHEPYPAFVIDRWWNVVGANQAASLLLPDAGDAAHPPNAVDLFLAPGPWREMIENWASVAHYALTRLRREVAEAAEDPQLVAILRRASKWLEGVPAPAESLEDVPTVCPRFRIGDTMLSTITTVARFGTARDVTTNELRVELMFPADEATESFFRSAAR